MRGVIQIMVRGMKTYVVGISSFCQQRESTNVHGPAKLFALGPSGEVGSTTFSGVRLARRGKDIPESKRFIRGGRDDRRSIGTDCHVEDTGRVTVELLNLGHCGIFPQAELIPRKAVRGKDFLLVWVPLQCTDL